MFVETPQTRGSKTLFEFPRGVATSFVPAQRWLPAIERRIQCEDLGTSCRWLRGGSFDEQTTAEVGECVAGGPKRQVEAGERQFVPRELASGNLLGLVQQARGIGCEVPIGNMVRKRESFPLQRHGVGRFLGQPACSSTS